MNEIAASTLMNEQQDTSGFEAFFLQNYKRVYGILYRLTGQKMEAEDLTIETFLRSMRRGPGSPERNPGWLYRVATRLGYNSLRARKRRAYYEEKAAALYIPGSPADPSRDFELSQEQNKVRMALRKMSRRSAQILVLHHSGFSYKEIAETIDVSPNSVGTLLARAQKEFEKKY